MKTSESALKAKAREQARRLDSKKNCLIKSLTRTGCESVRFFDDPLDQKAGEKGLERDLLDQIALAVGLLM